MSRIITSAALLAIVLAGPALQVYASSDRSYFYSYEPWPLLILHSPAGFFLCALLGYTLAIKPIHSRGDVGRMALAFLGAGIVGGAVGTMAAPVLYGLGDANSPLAAGVIGLVIGAGIAAIAGLAHHAILRSGVPARLEIPAHVAAMALPPVLVWAFAGHRSAHMQLFGAWPALLGLLPYALIVISRSNRSLALVRAPLLLLVSIAPAYATMALVEYAHDRGPALLWPVREAREFLSVPDRNALIQRVTTIRKGEPVRIGENWYQFERFSFYNPHPNHVPRPDRIAFVQITVPAADVGLPGSPTWTPGWVQLEIIDSRKGGTAAGRGFVHVRYQDLTVRVFRHDKDPEWPTEQIVHDRLLAFIQARQVPAPAVRN